MGLPGRLASATDLPAAELQLQEVALVGQYAVQIAFESGHGTGIYTWKYLRTLAAE